MKKYYGQFGEDTVLEQYFPGKSTGLCVEVGANDGVYGSNTLYFEQLGWQSILVEPIPGLADKCRISRPGAHVFNCAATAAGREGMATLIIPVEFDSMAALEMTTDSRRRLAGTGTAQTIEVRVQTRTLDHILEEAGGQKTIDFVSVDVEGHEFEVLQGFNCARWQPKVVVLERTTVYPDRRILAYFHRHGYELTRSTGAFDTCNDFFVRKGSITFSYRLRMIWQYYVKFTAQNPWRAIRQPLKNTLYSLGLYSFFKRLLAR